MQIIFFGPKSFFGMPYFDGSDFDERTNLFACFAGLNGLGVSALGLIFYVNRQKFVQLTFLINLAMIPVFLMASQLPDATCMWNIQLGLGSFVAYLNYLLVDMDDLMGKIGNISLFKTEKAYSLFEIENVYLTPKNWFNLNFLYNGFFMVGLIYDSDAFFGPNAITGMPFFTSESDPKAVLFGRMCGIIGLCFGLSNCLLGIDANILSKIDLMFNFVWFSISHGLAFGSFPGTTSEWETQFYIQTLLFAVSLYVNFKDYLFESTLEKLSGGYSLEKFVGFIVLYYGFFFTCMVMDASWFFGPNSVLKISYFEKELDARSNFFAWCAGINGLTAMSMPHFFNVDLRKFVHLTNMFNVLLVPPMLIMSQHEDATMLWIPQIFLHAFITKWNYDVMERADFYYRWTNVGLHKLFHPTEEGVLTSQNYFNFMALYNGFFMLGMYLDADKAFGPDAVTGMAFFDSNTDGKGLFFCRLCGAIGLCFLSSNVLLEIYPENLSKIALISEIAWFNVMHKVVRDKIGGATAEWENQYKFEFVVLAVCIAVNVLEYYNYWNTARKVVEGVSYAGRKISNAGKKASNWMGKMMDEAGEAMHEAAEAITHHEEKDATHHEDADAITN